MCCVGFFFLIVRRPQRSTRKESSAASDVYKRQLVDGIIVTAVSTDFAEKHPEIVERFMKVEKETLEYVNNLSLIHISEPTRLLSISYAVFCLKKKYNSCLYLS
ncbi:hypothetical protein CDFC105_30038 [Clostridioides difficile]|nr:hypothetical protein CDFC105_30038 [Clostridioides difficile]